MFGFNNSNNGLDIKRDNVTGNFWKLSLTPIGGVIHD